MPLPSWSSCSHCTRCAKDSQLQTQIHEADTQCRILLQRVSKVYHWTRRCMRELKHAASIVYCKSAKPVGNQSHNHLLVPCVESCLVYLSMLNNQASNTAKMLWVSELLHSTSLAWQNSAHNYGPAHDMGLSVWAAFTLPPSQAESSISLPLWWSQQLISRQEQNAKGIPLRITVGLQGLEWPFPSNNINSIQHKRSMTMKLQIYIKGWLHWRTVKHFIHALQSVPKK